MENPLPPATMAAIFARWRQRHQAVMQSIESVRSFPPPRRVNVAALGIASSEAFGTPTITSAEQPELLLGSELVVLGKKTSEGQIIEAVAAPWRAIFKELLRDPEFLLRFEPRQMEELIAASYKELGYQVTLTPKSGDGGRDVIAIHDGIKVRLLDQVKRYAPHHIVDADEVRSLFGVVSLDQAASKGVVTTTSDFAPGVAKEFEKVIPYRLELRNGTALYKLIEELAKKA